MYARFINILSIIALASILCCGLSCGGSSNSTPKTFTFTLDADGGSQEAADPETGGTLEITVPPGAVDNNIEITISRTDMSNYQAGYFTLASGQSLAPLTSVWKFEPAGTVFKKPVTIKIPYNAGVIADNVVAFHWSLPGKENIMEVPQSSRIEGNSVVAEIEHFSTGFGGYADGEVPINLPANMATLPLPWATDVALYQPVVLMLTSEDSQDTLPTIADLQLTLTTGETAVSGIVRRDDTDGRSVVFLPDTMLALDTTYNASFSIDGTQYDFTFTTQSVAEDLPFTGNAAAIAAGESSWAFHFDDESFSLGAPATALDSLGNIVSGNANSGYLDMLSLLYVETDSNTGETSLYAGKGETMLYEGSDAFLVNHTSTGYRFKLMSQGNQFLYNGPVTISTYDDAFGYEPKSYTFDNMYFGGTITMVDDKPTVSRVFLAAYIADCTALATYLENNLLAVLALTSVCDLEASVPSTLFAYGSGNLTTAEIAKVANPSAAIADGKVTVSWDTPLNTKWWEFRRKNFVFEFFDANGDLSLSSADYWENVLRNDVDDTCFTQISEHHWEFECLSFELPENKLTAGDYSLRFTAPLHAFDAGMVTVPAK